MTLGQKLKSLLKDNRMTQEDLAERLEVSRQAVGKWVNDKGIPEVGKLIQISNLFGVTLDYLLKEDCAEKEEQNNVSNISKETSLDSGYYVSQEMLEGYLAYSRQNVRQIAGGISLFLLSNIFECFDRHNEILSFLYWFTMIVGICILLWNFFQIKQYQEIKRERLIFDDEVFREFQRRREIRRKRYAVMIIVSVVILFGSSEIESLFMNYFGRTAGNVFGWIADTAWMTLMIWAGMSMHIDSMIIKNTDNMQIAEKIGEKGK